MKNLAIAAFAIGLAVATPTLLLAQPHPDQGHPAGGHPGGGGHPSPIGGGHAQMSAPAAHMGSMPHTARPSAYHAAHPTAYHHGASHPAASHHHGVVHHATHTVRAVTHHVARHVTHRVIRGATHAARPGRARIAGLRRNVIAAHRYHAGRYRAPPGFRYHRWVFGQRLPGIYFAPQFWIGDYLAYGLFGPPDGYVWVRYGPDAMLIDEYTGEIVQVDYGVFY